MFLYVFVKGFCFLFSIQSIAFFVSKKGIEKETLSVVVPSPILLSFLFLRFLVLYANEHYTWMRGVCKGEYRGLRWGLVRQMEKPGVAYTSTIILVKDYLV